MAKSPRKRLLVDWKLQGTLMLRIVVYWCFYWVAVSLILLCWTVIQGPVGPFLDQFQFNQLWNEYGAIVAASLLILPVLLVDALLTSNRVAGPLFRVRRAMRDLAAGRPTQPVKFRRKDLGKGLIDDFNALIAYVEHLKKQAAAVPAECSLPHDDEAELQETAGNRT